MKWLLLRSTLGLGGVIASATGCAARASATDASTDGTGPFDAAALDGTGAGTPCGRNGSSVIHVHFASSADAGSGSDGVWIGALCTDTAGVQHSTRVVALATDATDTTLTSLGPGRYVVRASASAFEGVSSPSVDVGPAENVTTTLYLPMGAVPLATVRADFADGGDADASTASDAGAGTTRRFTAAIPTGPQSVAQTVVTVSPHDGASFDVVVEVTAQTCADCAPLRLTSAELRLRSAGVPAALALADFDGLGAPVVAGQTRTTPLRTLPGSWTGADLALEVLVFGTLGNGDAGLATDAAADADR